MPHRAKAPLRPRHRKPDTRPSARQRGYDAEWEQVAAYVLKRDPYCRIQIKCNGALSTCVDHVVPLFAGGARLDPSNLQGACGPCNTIKGHADRRKYNRPTAGDRGAG